MTRQLKITIAAAFIVCFLGGGGWFWYLSGRSLEDADRLSSILAGFGSLLFGLTGLVYGYATLHQRGSGKALAHPSVPAALPSPAPAPLVQGEVHGPLVTGNRYVFLVDGSSRRMVVLLVLVAVALLGSSGFIALERDHKTEKATAGAYTVVVYGSAAGGSAFERQGELRIRPAATGQKWCLRVGNPWAAPAPGSIWFGTHGTCFGSGPDGPVARVEDGDGETVITPTRPDKLASFTATSGLLAHPYTPDRGSVRYRAAPSRLDGAIALEGLDAFGGSERGAFTTTFTAVLASTDPDALLSSPVDPVPQVSPVPTTPAPKAAGTRYTVKTIVSFRQLQGAAAFVDSAKARFAGATFVLDPRDVGDFLYAPPDGLFPLKGSVRGDGPIFTLAARRSSDAARTSVGGTLDLTGAEPTVRLTLTTTAVLTDGTRTQENTTSYEVVAVLAAAP